MCVNRTHSIFLSYLAEIMMDVRFLCKLHSCACGLWEFLGAPTHLYNWLCPSVCLSVVLSVCLLGNAFVRRSTRRTLLAYTFFLYKHQVYKHAQPQILEKFKETRPSRPIRCDVWIVERMRYPTDQPTDQRTQPVIEVLCRTVRLAPKK